jgi:hypothetical protein
MTRLENLLQEARSLSPVELARLLDELHHHAGSLSSAEEIEIGLRGLAAWTESSRDENWEAFYPPTLRNGRGGSQ